MAHKFTAIRYGFWAEFRKDNIDAPRSSRPCRPCWSCLCCTGCNGNIRILQWQGYQPGAEWRRSRLQDPWLIFCFAFPLRILIWKWRYYLFTGSNLLTMIGMIGLQVNAMIASFNMLPVSVLDGRRSYAWNKAVFVLSFLLHSVCSAMASFYFFKLI